MVLRSVCLAGALLLLTLAAEAGTAVYPVVSAEELRERLLSSDPVMLIDVRPNDEYRSGHVPGAVNIPLERFEASTGRLPKDKNVPLILYCRGGG